MAIRELAPMLQIVGQGNTQAARANQTYQQSPDQSANATFVVQGEVEVAHDDGTYEVFIHSQGLRQLCSTTTDEPFVQGSQVWVSMVQDKTWVIHGSIKG